MTIAEFITLWDTTNHSDIYIYYYYNGVRMFKHELTKINYELKSIVLKIDNETLQQHHVYIDHDDIENFNYDQEIFYNELSVVLPENTYLQTLHMYLE